MLIFAAGAATNSLTITGCKIEGNTAFWPPVNLGAGGGIRLVGEGTVTVSRCVIRDNQADVHGGGIFTKYVGVAAAAGTTLTVTIKDSLIMNNSVIVQSYGDGGGIAFGDLTNSSLINCTLSNNYARDKGGGIYYFAAGTRTIANSILWNDRSGLQYNPSEIYVHTGVTPTVTYSDIQGALWPGTGNLNSDPRFCSAASNDYHLSASPIVSPCIDTANNAVAGTTDLDGNTRIKDGPDADTLLEVDMGAYEYQGTGTGCSAGGLALACSTSTCKTATIFSAVPADGQRDARRPHPNSGSPGVPVVFSTRTGIGSPNTYPGGPEPITITLKNGTTLVSGATAPTCWSLCETDIELVESPTPTLVANRIVSIQETSTGVYSILLERPISGANWTTLKYLGGSSAVSYASLPADSNQSGTSNSTDMLWLIDCCLNCVCAGGCSTDLYRCDIDHSGAIAPADNLALIDLLNGAGNFIMWNGKSLPLTNSCLGGAFAAFAGGESGDPEDNVYFADWFVAYLVDADPADAEEQFEFEMIVESLTGWVLDHFPVEEIEALAKALTDPKLEFASETGAKVAVGVVAALTP